MLFFAHRWVQCFRSISACCAFVVVSFFQLELDQDHNARILFSYEEAIGFCVGDVVRDKDGVTAAVSHCRIEFILLVLADTTSSSTKK